MSLTTKQYQTIIRMYDDRRSKSKRILEDHLSNVRSNIPEYSLLEDLAAETALKYGRLLLSDSPVTLSDMDRELDNISKQKISLLKSHGYSEDYVAPSYVCSDCKDTGYIDNKKCHCFKQAEIEIMYNQSNIVNQLSTDNFDHLRNDFLSDDELIRFNKTVDFCHKFIDCFDSDYQNIMFCGTVGTGKSFLSGCIAYDLLSSGHSVIYFSASELFATLSNNMFHRTDSDEEDITCNSDLYECDLLVIDDLGTEIGGQFVNSSLFSLLNERHIRRKATIISTNLDFAGIQNRYSDRVFSRLLGNFNIFKLVGPDLRMKYKNK